MKNFEKIILIIIIIAAIVGIGFLGYGYYQKLTRTVQNPVATIEVENFGTIKVELYPDIAPNTVANFITLANRGYYDGKTFHRTVPDFMIQGGSKDGDGKGAPTISDIKDEGSTTETYAIKGEFIANDYSKNTLKMKKGVIAMARADYSNVSSSLTKNGYNSADSQFFIMNADNDNINGLYDDAFWRDNPMNLAYEHTAYTSMDKIMKVAKNKGYRLTSEKDLLLNYSADEVSIENEESSLKADNVSIRYSNVVTTSYKYNPTDKLYYRSVNGSVQKDYVTKKQYTTKNIIISYVDNGNISNDNKGRQELNNIGTGKGYYITDGYSIPITWTKTSRNEQTVYKKLNGEEITVNDGNTFIQIAPKDSAKIS